MAKSDSLRSEIARLRAKGATLSAEAAKHRNAAAKASAAASKKRAEASRTRSETTRRSATSAAEREEKKDVDAHKKLADVEKKIADNDKAIASKETSLTSALKSEQTTLDRETEKRHRSELQHARDIARTAATPSIVRYVEVEQPKPEPLRVLYLTANPETVETTTTLPDGATKRQGVWLRVDYEVRQVKERVKNSKYRDLIAIEHLPAATTMDLLNGLNEHRPHVVHFSGHADDLGLLMENDQGTQGGDDLGFDLLRRLLASTDVPPRLLVLNACESLAGAGDLLQSVPTVIAMADSIDDASAVVFAAQFYAAIASAQSVESAFNQAKIAIEAGSLDGAELPEVRARDDIDLATLVLVRPDLPKDGWLRSS